MHYITARKLVTQTPQAINWLVPDRLIAGGLNLLAGEVASGKTFLSLDLALGVSTRGETWGGLSVPTGPALYYCLDSSPTTIGHRLRSLCNGYAIEPPDNLHFDFDLHDLSDPQEIEALRKRIEEERYSLVIIDVMARYLPGMDENTVASIGPVFTSLRKLTSETGATLLLIHHFNKGGIRGSSLSQGLRIRGSSDIFGAVDTALTLVIRSSCRYLLPVKNRMGQEAGSLSFSIAKGEDNSIRLDFFGNEEEDEEPIVGTIGEHALNMILKIMMTKAGNYFTRDVLEDLLTDYGPVPSERTLDTIFSKLPEIPDIQVTKKDRYKYYGYFGETGYSNSTESVDEDPDLDDEEKEWQAVDEELQAQKVERAKEMLKKVLLPKLEEVRRKMKEELNN